MNQKRSVGALVSGKSDRRSGTWRDRVIPLVNHAPEPVHVPRRMGQLLVEQELISFSWEHHHALWFGQVLTFSPSQRACFKVLWDNFLRGNLPIPNERLLSATDGATTHVYHLFKRHMAWKTVIVGDGHGNFWLYVPRPIVLTHENAPDAFAAEPRRQHRIAEAEWVFARSPTN